jgi:hypothetical protein
MKYEIGDKIIVLHSNDEGEVIDIINEKMVMIQVRGVKFPAYMDQIDFPYFKRFTEKKLFPKDTKPKTYIDQVPKEKIKQQQKEIRQEDGIWLSLIPKFENDLFGDEVVSSFKVFLSNRTSQGYHFKYKISFLGHVDFEHTNELLSFQEFYLHDVPFENVNDSPILEFEFSLARPDKHKADFCEAIWKIKPKQFFQRIEELKLKNEPSINHKLIDKFPDKIFKDERLDLSKLSNSGFKIYDAKNARQHLDAARSVVDLHIEKITDEWKHLSNFEIITLQLKEFEKWYDLAVAHRQPSLIIIHGIGKGKLKDEIHDILKTKKEVKTFVNQYEPRFGYGATEIFFQY